MKNNKTNLMLASIITSNNYQQNLYIRCVDENYDNLG